VISNSIFQSIDITAYFRQWVVAWNAFWFAPRAATTLGLIRISAGSIAFYSLLVWSRELLTFLGPDGMLPASYRQLYFGSPAWSHFDWITSANGIWISHWICLIIVALFTLGAFSRVTAVATALILISYANRATGALFGLDQVLVMLCLYTAIGKSGGAFSIDQLWKTANSEPKSVGTLFQRWNGMDSKDTSTNIAIRLIQLHLCLIYFYAGLGKLQGETWWNGQAIWFSVASYEYQTLDLTWLADHMDWVALLTLITVYWEVTYPALIWYRLTRPIYLMIAVLTHLGIGLAMGMMTFGMVMLVANLSFIEFSAEPAQDSGID
jgi:hypothetical protein